MKEAMRRIVCCVVGAGLLCCACSGDAAGPATMIDLTQPWTRATPAGAGMDPELTTRAVSAAASVSRVRALLVARRGRLVVEQYFGGADTTTRFDVRSVTKSIVSAVTGIALSRGRLPGLAATVGTYIGAPDTLDPGDSAVTIAELLTMTSGYQWNETSGSDYNLWVISPNRIQFLLDRAQAGPPRPFTYNSAAVHLLGVLVQRAAGAPLPEFADSVLFMPAGITSAIWEPLDSGTVNGGSGIALTGRDLLRYGQLLLQEGRSGNRQIIPADWVHHDRAAFPLAGHCGAAARCHVRLSVVGDGWAACARVFRVGIRGPVRLYRARSRSRRGRRDRVDGRRRYRAGDRGQRIVGD